MLCIKALILASLRFTANLFNSSPFQPRDHARFLHFDETLPAENFKQELDLIPDSSLHSALHEHLPNVFKDGMFEHDSSAVEAIYRTNPTLATKLVAAARYDLLRRQNGNLTTTSTPPPVIVPVTITSTDPSGSTVTTVATALSSATVSIETVLTTTNAAGKTTLLTTVVPGALVTNSNGQVQTTAAPTLNSNGDIVLTTTNAQGSTYVTTITPSGGVFSSIVLETTTLPDGSRSTYTSFAIVPAPTGGTATGGPHLQGGAGIVKPSSVSLSGILVLAVAFGALLM
jgi:hypothetical protein